MSLSSSDPAAALAEAVKAVHRRFPTGVTIVTTKLDGQPFGLAVNAFSSLSLEPPLVLACVAATSSTYPHLFKTDAIAVNILAADQLDVASTFARSGGDKFARIAWHPGENGAPVLDGAAAHLELTVQNRVPAGTHTIFIGRVVAAAASERAPMVYLGGGFYDGAGLPALKPSDRAKETK